MKQGFHRRFFTFTSFFVMAWNLSSCSADSSDKNPDTVHVKIPWYDGSSYTLQTVTLNTVKEMSTLQGGSARFLMSPGNSGGKLVGYQPHIRTMRTSDGTYIPEDYLSVQMLTLYAHFEKLTDLDIQLGMPTRIPNWQRQQTVAVSVQVADSMNSNVLDTDNAMYTGDYDAYLFLPYTRPDLPFSVNAGVIGHEHFHSLFNQLLIHPLAEKYPLSQRRSQAGTPLSQTGTLLLTAPTAHPIDKILSLMGLTPVGRERSAGEDSSQSSARDQYHAYLLRGLNEGLADVWGWIYSDDHDFVLKSAPAFTQRSLEFDNHLPLTVGQVSLMTAPRGKKMPSPMDDGSVYQLGTVFAHRLYQSVQAAVSARKVSLIDGKILLAKAILQALPELKSEFAGLSQDQQLDPIRPLQLIQAHTTNLNIQAQPEAK